MTQAQRVHATNPSKKIAKNHMQKKLLTVWENFLSEPIEMYREQYGEYAYWC